MARCSKGCACHAKCQGIPWTRTGDAHGFLQTSLTEVTADHPSPLELGLGSAMVGQLHEETGISGPTPFSLTCFLSFNKHIIAGSQWAPCVKSNAICLPSFHPSQSPGTTVCTFLFSSSLLLCKPGKRNAVDIQSVGPGVGGPISNPAPHSLDEWLWVRHLVSSSVKQEQKHSLPNTVVRDM